MADAERLGIDQHEGGARHLLAAVDPGVIGAALDHHVAGLELHGRVIHVHVELALHHDHVVDGLGAMHAAGIAGVEGEPREPRAEPRGRPSAGGGVPRMRAPISSTFSPSGIAAGAPSVIQISVDCAPDAPPLWLIASPSMITLATFFSSCPVTTRRIGGYFGCLLLMSALS